MTVLTKYRILVQHVGQADTVADVGADWRLVAEIEATSGEAAIRKHVADSEVGGTYVAIPARSFTPIKATVESKPVVSFA